MISGAEPAPAGNVSAVTITIADNGRRSIDAAIAVIPTATAGVTARPGRCDASKPPAAPMNSAGNVGPPRNAPSDTAQAAPLQTTTQANAPADQVPELATRPDSVSCPENSTCATP